MSEVFVSYRRNDLAVVARLVEALRTEGLEVWWDQDIPPSAPWEQTIESQLSAARVVLVAWSAAAVASENVKAEARWALRQGRLLQVFVGACEPPLFFGERQGIDLAAWSGSASDPAFRAIVGAVRGGPTAPSGHAPDSRTRQPAAGVGASYKGTCILPTGTVLNGIFEVRRLVGSGPLVELYEGANVTTHERVAIKAFRSGIDIQRPLPEAFLRELTVLTHLNHEAIVPYRVAAREPTHGSLYLVSDFVDGIPLSALVGQVMAPEPKLRAFIQRMAEALKYAHRLGVVHGGISPDNILLAGGLLEQSVLVDFELTEPAYAMGTDPKANAPSKPYSAPEQQGRFDGEIGPWTDVFSLGRVILSLATGVRPDVSVSEGWVGERLDGDVVRSAHPGLRRLLSGMLAPDPAERLRNMSDVLAAIKEAPELRNAARH